MKSKNLIIIGGAVALFYLYQKNKNKKSITLTDIENSDVATSNGGGALIGGLPMPSLINPVNTLLNGGTVSGIKSTSTLITPATNIIPLVPFTISTITQAETDTTPIRTIINPPAIVTPIEVAIQQGGVSTNPQPSIALEPSLTTEGALISGNVIPIVRPTRSLSTSIM